MSSSPVRKPSESRLELRLNGELREVPRAPKRKLVEVLRIELGLTGTKFGCGEGACGACTVLIDGRPVEACQTFIEEVEGRSVTTVEGLSAGGKLNAVQRAFADLGSFQCGFCTPGMVVRATALLQINPHPTPDQIREAMEGSLCRCGGYRRILGAIERAAENGGTP